MGQIWVKYDYAKWIFRWQNYDRDPWKLYSNVITVLRETKCEPDAMQDARGDSISIFSAWRHALYQNLIFIRNPRCQWSRVKRLMSLHVAIKSEINSLVSPSIQDHVLLRITISIIIGGSSGAIGSLESRLFRTIVACRCNFKRRTGKNGRKRTVTKDSIEKGSGTVDVRPDVCTRGTWTADYCWI